MTVRELVEILNDQPAEAEVLRLEDYGNEKINRITVTTVYEADVKTTKIELY